MEELSGIEIAIRHCLRPGDPGRVTEMHGLVYAQEYGFDHTFEAYVAATLGEFGRQYRPERDRLWLAEQGDQLVGSIAIVGRSDDSAQLRWFLVHPALRGHGLGSHLHALSLDFCRSTGYHHVYLSWTAGEPGWSGSLSRPQHLHGTPPGTPAPFPHPSAWPSQSRRRPVAPYRYRRGDDCLRGGRG